MNNHFDLEVISPKLPLELETQKQINSLGLEIFNLLQTFEHLKSEIKKESSKQPHVIWQLITQFIKTLSTKDPNNVHFEIARHVLQSIDSTLLDDTKIIDHLSRELCDYCKRLSLKLTPPEQFKEIQDESKQAAEIAIINANLDNNSCLDIIELDDTNIDKLFEKDKMFLWDNIYYALLHTVGKEGPIATKDLKETFTSNFEKINSSENNTISFWFNTTQSNVPFYISPALQIITRVLYIDKVKRLVNFKKQYTPALTTNVLNPLKTILSPKNTIYEKDENTLQLIHQESIIGNITMPAISEKFCKQLCNGMKKLNKVTGHKLIRYFPTKAFDQMTSGHSDWRIIRCDRGASEIAEQLGLKAKPEITNIKEIINAMAYCEFTGPHLSGNLIQLTKYKSPITHREEAFLITVGTPLLPYQTFKDGGFLIPLLTDPPLVHPTQSHASQYLLQMEIMSEFGEQSVALFHDNVIEITQKKWEELAASCNISPEVLKKIQDRWIQDGDDAAKFLEKTNENFYTLGTEHKKALDMLKDQGRLKETQSQRGKASVIKRNEKLKRNGK